MKKILLINPKSHKLNGKNSSRFRLPPWALCVLASLTPKNYDVEIVDELLEDIDFNQKVDLVGITGFTASINRGYEIAAKFKSKGVPVVMGGLHVSSNPDEALTFADAVVVGEAEMIWEQVLKDLENNKMKGIYKSNEFHDMQSLPWPRLDLIKYPEKYTAFQFVQTTRGCPFKCEFCSATQIWGSKYRKRPVDEVIEEVKSLDNTKPIFFIDDNIGAIPKYQKELFEKLIPLKIKWSSQTGVQSLLREGAIELAAESGCFFYFVGFESPNEEALKHSNKKQNDPKLFKEIIRKAQKKGIHIHGAFVLGLDYDDENIFKDVNNFIEDAKLDSIQLNILYPYPGTALRERFIKNNRLTSSDWSNYIFDGVNFIPKNMTQKELHKGYVWLLKQNTRFPIIFRRFFRKIKMGQFYQAFIALVMNLGTRRHYNHVIKNLKKVNPIKELSY
ncbi:MAG: hypothetical protein A2015_05065 [Spirochaetes bacterium GWF1_31_7]|nr:MAG: hypothetical protein A2Y30_06465 [Spirochaetes bacterium GWE1_32_154]OHD47214.1 MAG: hypothetical protein A2015_05065 [Spirochaetes bacterium GWF1_31_7]OHD52641.1 MAG: hypothetical protein A2Y29_09700 [Spirochaetes bacterium GWE2_31_10]